MNEQLQTIQGAPLFNPQSPEFIANPYPGDHRLRAVYLTSSSRRSRSRIGELVMPNLPTIRR